MAADMMGVASATEARAPIGSGAKPMLARAFAGKVGPVLAVIAALIVIWYAAVIRLNAPWAYDQAQRANTEISFSQLVASTMAQERPVLQGLDVKEDLRRERFVDLP